MAYQRRVIDDELDELFTQLPAIAIDGAKGVGKTSTAEERAFGLVKLDSKAVREGVAADPESILRRPLPLLIDEWQKVPEVWDVVRRAVDADRAPGRFLLTGSATPEPRATAHSGAGRITRLRMRPMTLSERGVTEPTITMRELLRGDRPELHGTSDLRLADYASEIVAPGLPGLRGLSPRATRAALESYVRNAVDRDVPEAGLQLRRPEVMLDWLRAYAAATASTASYTEILDAATAGATDKPAKATTIAYRDALAQIWLLDPVPAWAPVGAEFTRLGQTPKHHLADPALAAHLLGLGLDALIDGDGRPLGPQESTMLGRLFESLVTLCVRVMAQAAESTVGHLRTRNGDHEVDLVVVRADGRVVAVEAKLASTVSDRDARHLRWFADQLGPRLLDAIIINTGPTAYRRPDGIGVVPLAVLGS
jgi:predicted AAA+ superfamily ATPase